MSDHDHDHDAPPLPQKLLDAATAGCSESQLLINRRHLMGLTAGLFAWAHMPRHAEAAGTEPRLLIVLMCGALDGMHVAAPLSDPRYASLRGRLALDASRQNPLTLKDGTSTGFWLNSVMPRFLGMYNSGDAALVQAVAPPLTIGSHFEGQYSVESGLPASGARTSTDGWLNRLLQFLPAGSAVKMDTMHVGPTPLIVSGPAPVLAWTPGVAETPALQAPVQSLYNLTNPELADLFRRGLSVNAIATNNAPIGSGLSMVRQGFIGTARLMKSPNGPRIAVLNTDGWDTHAGQSAVLSTKLADFDTSLDAFRQEMGDAWQNTAVVCVTEMGRRVATNGTSGTDHGVASVAFLAGGAINGRRMFGEWPGLSTLADGVSLRATTDMRALFKGLLQDHLQVPRALLDTKVFPGSQAVAPMRDLLKAPAQAAPAVAKAQAPAASVASASSTSRARARRSARLASASPAPASGPRYESAIARFRRTNGAG